MIRSRQLATKKRYTVPIPEVQIAGSLIGSGLSDTGIADATNLLVSTQQAFSGVDWIATAMTASDSGVTDPNSGTTASTLTETTANSHHVLIQGWYTAASAASYTHTIYMKQGLRTRCAVVLRDSLPSNSGNFALCTYDLAAGAIAIAASVGGTFSAQSAAITAESNGFYLCALTATTSGSGAYTLEIYADSGSGSGASSLTYTGNAGSVALTIWGAGIWAGAAGTYVPLNADRVGAAASTINQAFSPNGSTTSYWGTQTNNAWVGFDAKIPVIPTRHRIAPRLSAASQVGQWPYAPDYTRNIAGSLVQTDVADSTFASPTTIDTIPAANVLPYYPRYELSERAITGAAAARYARFLPPPTSFGSLSAWQFFAKAGPIAPAMPVQPVISPMGGRFPSLAPIITITSLTQGAGIYYNVGVSSPPADPTPTTSRKYTGPFIQTISSGGTVYIKAVAHLAGLSTPISLVTTSAPFRGYGFKPKDDEFDNNGILVEAHAGDVMWDPNTSSYYRVGQFMNINTVLHFSSTPEPNYAPAVFLYKGVPLDPKDPGGFLNWTNLGPILNDPFPTQPVAGNYNILYNSSNNNYVIWTSVINSSSQATAYYASTAGSNIAGPWTWNLTPIVSNTFFNFSIMVDSDGATAWAAWRNSNTQTTIQQLNSGYTGLTGGTLVLTSGNLREGFAFFKWPNVSGGTYFLIAGTANPYDSTAEIDARYIYNQGSSPIVNTWSAVPSSGASIWGSDPIGTNYNGQPFGMFLPQGCTEPVFTADYWVEGNLYASRQVWLPINLTNSTTLQVQQPASWDPSQLATTYALNNLTLSSSTFSVGASQGTVIGTVQNYLVENWVTLTDSHSGAVQLVGGVIQVGATPPGTSGSFNISLTETPNIGAPHVTTISITEAAVAPQVNGSVTTFTTAQAINLTSLAGTDWAAYGYNVNAASIERKATGGSLISALTQVGGTALANFNNSSGTPKWSISWTDGTPNTTVTSEAYIVFVNGTTTQGMSFTVPADTTLRTLGVYVTVSNNTTTTTTGKLTATLSDASAGPYTDTSVGTLSTDTGNKMGHYTITYEAASSGQTLTVVWINDNAGGQNVQISAVTLS